MFVEHKIEQKPKTHIFLKYIDIDTFFLSSIWK